MEDVGFSSALEVTLREYLDPVPGVESCLYQLLHSDDDQG